MTRILVAYGESKAIATLMKVSLPTVRQSLRGTLRSDLAMRIRKLALERGGMETINKNN